MKKIILVFGLFIFALNTNAQLNQYAQFIKENYNPDYEITIKKFAIEKYGMDHPMLEVEINDQSESLFTIIDRYEYKNREVLYNAIIESSFDGYERKNKGIIKNLKQISLPNLLKLHCNWLDVLYKYNNQIEVKD